jgi:hypothetical protein
LVFRVPEFEEKKEHGNPPFGYTLTKIGFTLAHSKGAPRHIPDFELNYNNNINKEGKITWPRHPYFGKHLLEKTSGLWESLSGIVLWTIWKARCMKVFKGKETPPIETLKIWQQVIFTMRAHFESLKGNFLQQIQLHRLWAQGPFCKLYDAISVWIYTTPRYLFVPLIS